MLFSPQEYTVGNSLHAGHSTGQAGNLSEIWHAFTQGHGIDWNISVTALSTLPSPTLS